MTLITVFSRIKNSQVKIITDLLKYQFNLIEIIVKQKLLTLQNCLILINCRQEVVLLINHTKI